MIKNVNTAAGAIRVKRSKKKESRTHSSRAHIAFAFIYLFLFASDSNKGAIQRPATAPNGNLGPRKRRHIPQLPVVEAEMGDVFKLAHKKGRRRMRGTATFKLKIHDCKQLLIFSFYASLLST
jgi:hypothetical protein